jgi:hypothetical protein
LLVRSVTVASCVDLWHSAASIAVSDSMKLHVKFCVACRVTKLHLSSKYLSRKQH